jgi:hypothetical protein
MSIEIMKFVKNLMGKDIVFWDGRNKRRTSRHIAAHGKIFCRQRTRTQCLFSGKAHTFASGAAKGKQG